MEYASETKLEQNVTWQLAILVTVLWNWYKVSGKIQKKIMWCCLQKLNEGKGQSSLVFLENKRLCPILHTLYTQRQKYQQENLRVKVKFRYM